MLEEVIEAVREVAQQVIMPRYLQVDRQIKADGSFFTEADVAAQNALLEKLQKNSSSRRDGRRNDKAGAGSTVDQRTIRFVEHRPDRWHI